MSAESEQKVTETVAQDSDDGVDLVGDGGVLKKILEAGGDESPSKGVKVRVHYVGTLLDGTEFDANRPGDNPFEFDLGAGAVIKGWDVGVASMAKGEKCILTCREDYAYGENGSPPKIPAGATLKFEVTLLDWKWAKVTMDELITKKVITEGEGYQKPNEYSSVTVKYTGIVKGSGSVFSPEQERKMIVGDEDDVPSGFNTVLKHLSKGERTVFWIQPSGHHFEPAFLPDGVSENDTLEYDIEMIDFTRAKQNWEMDVAEKIVFAARCKSRGNDYFKSNNLRKASKKYELVISTLESFTGASDEQNAEAKATRIASWNNLANVEMRQGKYQDVVKNTTKVIEVDFNNVKALFRRSKAYLFSNDLSDAMRDVNTALAVEPENKLLIQHLKVCSHKVKKNEAKQRSLYQGMFSKKGVFSSPRDPSAIESKRTLPEDDEPASAMSENADVFGNADDIPPLESVDDSIKIATSKEDLLASTLDSGAADADEAPPPLEVAPDDES